MVSELRLFSHHFHTDLTGFHIDIVFQISFSNYFAEKQQQLGLAIRQSIPFHMVTVEVIINRKSLTQQKLLSF